MPYNTENWEKSIKGAESGPLRLEKLVGTLVSHSNACFVALTLTKQTHNQCTHFFPKNIFPYCSTVKRNQQTLIKAPSDFKQCGTVREPQTVCNKLCKDVCVYLRRSWARWLATSILVALDSPWVSDHVCCRIVEKCRGVEWQCKTNNI